MIVHEMHVQLADIDRAVVLVPRVHVEHRDLLRLRRPRRDLDLMFTLPSYLQNEKISVSHLLRFAFYCVTSLTTPRIIWSITSSTGALSSVKTTAPAGA